MTNVTTAVDPGIVVNPRQLQRMAEGGATMGTSEALHEQVHFNKSAITDHDWVTFPILRMVELPKIKIVILNNPERRGVRQRRRGPERVRPGERSPPRSSTRPARCRGRSRWSPDTSGG